MPTHLQHPSSFRDPSGFIFEANGKLYRQVNQVYGEHYRLLMESGLYENLSKKQWLLPHVETNQNLTASPDFYKTILPQYIPFISYPYEWCFEQLQDAALLTLQIMMVAMEHGMIIKDATPYNVQFLSGKPVFIDTLSFEKYDKSKPWIAYRQFCECFLFPLLISHYTAFEVHRLFAAYPEGIPSTITAGMLPGRARFSIRNWLHVYLPASVSSRHSDKQIRFNESKLKRIIEHLKSVIQSIKPSTRNNSTWNNYYNESILSKEYLSSKESLVQEMIQKIDLKSAIDLGCNQGLFSNLLIQKAGNIIAVDADPSSISNLYKEVRLGGTNILPLCIDLANPPGNSGFKNQERESFMQRLKFDLILALALIHHLAIGKNIPLEKLADFFSFTDRYLLIEFIPREDEKVQQLLADREDIFAGYNQNAFESAFSKYFQLLDKKRVNHSNRTIYLMKKNNQDYK